MSEKVNDYLEDFICYCEKCILNHKPAFLFGSDKIRQSLICETRDGRRPKGWSIETWKFYNTKINSVTIQIVNKRSREKRRDRILILTMIGNEKKKKEIESMGYSVFTIKNNKHCERVLQQDEGSK